MNVTRYDLFTGKHNTYDLNVTQEQLDAHANGGKIQEIMPQLTADEREFIISGTPIGEFDSRFPEDDDGDNDDGDYDFEDNNFDYPDDDY